MQRAPSSYRRIAAHLRRGGLIAYPTESCYGLGCDPDNRSAVQRLLRLKQRPQHKGLILIAAGYHQVARFLQPLTHDQQQRLKTAGTQVVTCLMPALHSAPRWLRGSHDTLAVRLTAHKQAARLCRGVNSALVSTSANRSGQRPARTHAQCRRLFGNKVWVLPGRVGKRRNPSNIITWADGKIIR
ncbi:MAG: Threonylcarbamoyl-AMP synthase [Candidatus Gallionella acididurans]|uniref:Threonylcarbamoyl-AMP synthase n=1 Tax=Candidatus Gallionella acididurans TaxID=1796491 RepID=A0A139BTY4_9PROT|nr:MAG: Threonylcarbamoyl-AMP synthase [Candidatus Gallionella acididurans]